MENQPGYTGFKYPPPKPPLKGWKLISGMANLHVWSQGLYPPSLVKIRPLTKKPKEDVYWDSGMGVLFLHMTYKSQNFTLINLTQTYSLLVADKIMT